MKRLAAVPIYNGERFLDRTLRSLLEQSVPPDEIICLDDGSTDRSTSIVTLLDDPSIRLIRNPRRLGLAGNWNRALELAEDFDFLTIAHQDDIYERDYLEKVTGALSTHPSAFIAHTKATVIDEADRVVTLSATRYKDKFWPHEPLVERGVDEELRLLIRGDYIFCPSVTFRTSALTTIGTFDERFEFVPDWDFWLRGLFEGFTIVGVNERLIRYRSHPQSATKLAEKTLRRYQEEIDIVEHYARTASSRGMAIRADHTPAENTLAGGVMGLLLSGDRAEAKRVMRFGTENIPGFRQRFPGLVLALAIPFGRLGGWILHAGMNLYLLVARHPR
ncbi:MAG: glycosyltransferase [Acidobacteria bacterium]|nr:glycosyltransferase [Acidobacteriota bacterium]